MPTICIYIDLIEKNINGHRVVRALDQIINLHEKPVLTLAEAQRIINKWWYHWPHSALNWEPPNEHD